ncbi:hypothetical protein JQ596_30910 [Bradyrhizobium manausense]|uniref:hypothetical protein n=1 Tax=Bradyrhizobium manausense TaxID=989370 RepID=UPI001BA7E177|nr:hypothetical protein [Bradyrhizobium manausense]MBR0829948.1 hypothetical protein [Bradyrhizobium manausense]
MDDAAEPLRPVLVFTKEDDAVAAGLSPLFEKVEGHHAKRRGRGDRETRWALLFLRRANRGAGLFGMPHVESIDVS